ncbi:MAG: DUF6702 family protein [Crocinitomicaceae bacterium]
MKAILALILFLSASVITRAHEYYFAFAEVEYNVEAQRFEGTIIFTTHDLEKAIKEEHPEFPIMDTMSVRNPRFAHVGKRIEEGFYIQVNGQREKIKLEFLGIENFLTGTTNIYFQSERIESISDIKFGFKLLMNDYEGQQNKIEFKYGELKKTLYFINQENEQTLNLIKNQNE